MAAGQGTKPKIDGMDEDRTNIGAINMPRGSVATMSGETIGARVKSLHEELRKAVREELKVEGEDAETNAAIDDAITAAGFDQLVQAGGKRMKGGTRLGTAVRELAGRIKDRFIRTVETTESDAILLLNGLEMATNEVATASGRIGRGTAIAGVAGAVVVALPYAAEYVPSPSWETLVTGTLGFAKNIFIGAPLAAVSAAAQNPVLALAMATATLKIVSHYTGTPQTELLKMGANKLGEFGKKAVLAAAERLKLTSTSQLRDAAAAIRESAPGRLRGERMSALQSGDIIREEAAPEPGALGPTMPFARAMMYIPGPPEEERRQSRRRASAAAAAAAGEGSSSSGPVYNLRGRVVGGPANAAAAGQGPPPSSSSSSSSSSMLQEGGTTCGGRRRLLFAPTRKVRRFSSSSKKRYTRRRRALRS